MTVCCWRLTHPENSSKKNASGGGNGSIPKACPRGPLGSRTRCRGASIGPSFLRMQALVRLRQSAKRQVIRPRRSFRTGRRKSPRGCRDSIARVRLAPNANVRRRRHYMTYQRRGYKLDFERPVCHVRGPALTIPRAQGDDRR
jgi:hypothetical protein